MSRHLVGGCLLPLGRGVLGIRGVLSRGGIAPSCDEGFEPGEAQLRPFGGCVLIRLAGRGDCRLNLATIQQQADPFGVEPLTHHGRRFFLGNRGQFAFDHRKISQQPVADKVVDPALPCQVRFRQ